MYAEILNCTFSEAKNKFTEKKCVSNVSKAITFSNNKEIDSFSDESEIIVFYDVITEEPLTIVERLDREKVNNLKLQAAVEVFNNASTKYVACANESDTYIDLTVVHKNLTIK